MKRKQRTANKLLEKARLKCYIQHLEFYYTFVMI